MPANRQQICERTADKLRAARDLDALELMIGLDGFVDEIIAVVDKRHDLDHFEPIRTIEQFGRKVFDAAGRSSNYELVPRQVKLGGNGPIMANALAAVGTSVTYIGALGHPVMHPVFEGLAGKAQVISIADPGHTDALEFADGKVMLGKLSSLGDVNWQNLVGRLGLERLIEMVANASLICMVNWTMLPHMSDIWAHLIDEVLPRAGSSRKQLFIDLADPEKRAPDDILSALALLGRFQEYADVTLGLNLKESLEIAGVLSLPVRGRPEQMIEQGARDIRERFGLDCVVVHPRATAAAATADGSDVFAGPFVQSPRISTGAGDHFNAGFALGRLLGFELAESLCTGVALSGFYVRTAKSPSADELADFIAELPLPQAAED